MWYCFEAKICNLHRCLFCPEVLQSRHFSARRDGVSSWLLDNILPENKLDTDVSQRRGTCRNFKCALSFSFPCKLNSELPRSLMSFTAKISKKQTCFCRLSSPETSCPSRKACSYIAAPAGEKRSNTVIYNKRHHFVFASLLCVFVYIVILPLEDVIHPLLLINQTLSKVNSYVK